MVELNKKNSPNFINLKGQTFGKLIVIERIKNDKRGETRWLCKCKCGNTTKVLGSHLRKGETKSCGCFKLDRQKEIIKKNNIDFDTFYRLKYIFNHLKNRCINKKNLSYKNYGGRGIKVCDEWLDKKNGFSSFCNWAIQNGYQNNLTIDRIDVNKNYEPNNCRWVTMLEQENNRRNNIIIKYNEQTHTLKEWSRILNLNYNTMYSRYTKKFCIEDIFYDGNLKERNKYDIN